MICDLPIVYHVALDQVASSQSSHQGKLSSQDSGTHNPGQLPGVLPWTVLTGSLHAQHLHTQNHHDKCTQKCVYVYVSVSVCMYLQASLLRRQIGAPSHSAQLY